VFLIFLAFETIYGEINMVQDLNLANERYIVFCEHHGKTLENLKGTDCMAHLAEARCYECPYTIKNIKYGETFPGWKKQFYITIGENPETPWTGQCVDFKIREGIEDRIVYFKDEEKLKQALKILKGETPEGQLLLNF
jgi:hypothetical protein